MTDFIATIYEWFHYNTDLGQHLRGLDPVDCEDFIGTDLYLRVFLIMIGLNVCSFMLMYLLIDKLTAKFSSAVSWWITALITAAINFGIASSLPRTIDPCPTLHFDGGDLMLFGAANAWWSLVAFALLTSFPIPRNFSTNCRLTTFWKP